VPSAGWHTVCRMVVCASLRRVWSLANAKCCGLSTACVCRPRCGLLMADASLPRTCSRRDPTAPSETASWHRGSLASPTPMRTPAAFFLLQRRRRLRGGVPRRVRPPTTRGLASVRTGLCRPDVAMPPWPTYPRPRCRRVVSEALPLPPPPPVRRARRGGVGAAAPPSGNDRPSGGARVWGSGRRSRPLLHC